MSEGKEERADLHCSYLHFSLSLSLSLPSADFSCLSQEEDAAAAAPPSSLLAVELDTLAECDFLTNYNCNPKYLEKIKRGLVVKDAPRSEFS